MRLLQVCFGSTFDLDNTLNHILNMQHVETADDAIAYATSVQHLVIKMPDP